MTIFNVISLFGGLALFLYGMRLMGNGLKESSSGALKDAMEKVTNNPLVGFFLGVIVTAVIQSSTATIVLTSGLVGAGVITLHQSLGVIIGANVGTTITGQIIRLLDLNGSGGASWVDLFKPSTLAPLAAIIGILFIMAVKTKHAGVVGQIAMGFGILFTGLLNMTAAVSPLSESESFARMFVGLSDTPVLGFLAGTGVAFLIQSSSATIGILQALSMTGALTFSSVYAIIIGVNIGDCVTTAIVCSIGSKADAKRTGVVHILFNICGSVLIIVGLAVLRHMGVLDALWDKTLTSGGIANVHTVFRLVSAVALLPVCGQFEKLSRRIVKDDTQLGVSVERELELLDEKFFSSPALALSGAARAIGTMAKLSHEAVLGAMDVLYSYDQHTVDVINENEDRIDLLADRVDNYLIKLSPHVTMGNGNELLNFYIQCFSEFERIGDYAVNLTENAQELRDRGAQFSDMAREELRVLRDALDEIMGYAYQGFRTLDVRTARRIEPVEEVVDDLVATLRNNHIKRVRDGKCTIYAGLTFLDVLVNIERVSDQCSNVGVYTLSLSDSSIMSNHHEYIHKLHQGGDAEYNRRFGETREKYFGALAEADAKA
ncbi:MAG: Na/Pi cotransporter family protein [Ruminococcaceae bacterium]|nr:Na/Pi cotransporter family protein [Oscillospiraceae bacterium]